MLDELNERIILGNKTYKLTFYQNVLLEYLIANKHRLVSATELARYVYDSEEDKIILNKLRCLVFRINRKLGKHLQILSNRIGYKIIYIKENK